MPTAPRSPIVLCLVVTLLAAATSAHADEPSDAHAAANALLRQAQDAFVNDSDCTRALPLFEGALRLEPSWNALSGMAACRELQGQLDAAYRLYARILRDFGGVLPPRKRLRVEARIADLERKLATLELDLTPSEATITVDDTRYERAELPLRLNPGTHTVTISAAGHTAKTRTVTLTTGRSVTLRVMLVAVGPPKDAHLALAPSVPARRARPGRSPWLWRGLALSGVAAAAGGAGLLVLAQRDFDAFDQRVMGAPGSPSLPVDAPRDRYDEGSNKRIVGVVLIGVGASAIVGALLVRFWPTRSPPTPAIDLPRGGGASLGLAWSY